MLHVALSQIRLNYRRFIAIGLAVILAVAFLVSTLILGASAQATLKASFGQSYAQADAVLSPPNRQEFSQAAVDAVAGATQGGGTTITSVYPTLSVLTQVRSSSATFAAALRNTPEDRALEAREIIRGSFPANPGQVTIEQSTASQQSLDVGSTVLLTSLGKMAGDSQGEQYEGTQAEAADEVSSNGIPASEQRLEVVGIMSDGVDPLSAGLPSILASTETIAALTAQPLTYSSIQLALNGPLDGQTRTAITEALSQAGFEGSTVRSADEQILASMRGLTQGQDSVTLILLAFVAISLVVATLVVANTFAVLVAQRTRELALLRCLGAKKGQIRSSVIVEAALVGFLASLLGVGLAIGGMYALTAAARQLPGQDFTTFGMDWSTPVIGIIAGVLLAVVAALAPARAATAVAPLAALRPAEDAALSNRRGRVRLVLGALLLLTGTALLLVGAAQSNLRIALPGGVLSFFGVLLCASLFLPRLVAWVGLLAAPAGVPGQLAKLNAVRNPGRTATTASALLIGVTLVSLMLTGAATARAAFASSLDARYPVDIMVEAGTYSEAAVRTVAALDQVEASAQLPVVGTATLGSGPEPVFGISDEAARTLLSNPQNRPADGQVLLGRNNPGAAPAADLTFTTANGQRTLPVAEAASRGLPLLVSSEAAPSGDPAFSHQSAIWLKLDPAASPDQIQELQRQVATTLGVEPIQISGGALEKASFNQVINILLTVVTGLLAVAVLIALIGVANTLSLSVLERTRENALLRALGLSRKALRGMLALEALLIAGVAALVGTGLGAVYGWLGAQSALGSFATVTAAEIPWLQLALVVAVAAVAGLAASVIPARRAARLSPVAGLATE